jgi:lipopolysaccharide/colanic/teichoic acid biosynthesis glycosyltransferase
MESHSTPLEKIRLPLAKRWFDIFFSLFIILALSPLVAFILFISLIERLLFPSARGPLFYTETRISQGQPFTIYKFRTFRVSAIASARTSGVIHTKHLENDFRNQTIAGILFVQTYMDEYPQLFLVLSGKMSLVGPRPTNVEAYERYVREGGTAKTILTAGLTGKFQSHKGRKLKLNQEETDLRYAELCRNGSTLEILKYDLLVLLHTAYTVVRAEGI